MSLPPSELIVPLENGDVLNSADGVVLVGGLFD